MSGYGDPGAPDDAYAEAGRTGGQLPQVDDPELRALIDEFVRTHPGISRADAMNQILRNRRDAKARKALVESLASAIETDADIKFIDDQIAAFNKWVCDQDEGDDGVEIRQIAA
jgi:hypothetical protein